MFYLFFIPENSNIKSKFQFHFKDFAARSLNAWYSEIDLYDFEKAEYSQETVHFIIFFIKI